MIHDSPKIVNKIEAYFKVKPNLNELQCQGKSLFYHVAAHAHYSKNSKHSFLLHMLEKTHYIPTEEEKKEMSHFYIYDENGPVQPFLKLVEIYVERLKLDKLLNKNSNNQSTQTKLKL